MNILSKKFYFDCSKFNIMEKDSSVLFISDKYFKWFKTSLSGKDILLKFNGKDSLETIIKSISIEYNLPRNVIEEDICSFSKVALDKKFIFESNTTLEKLKLDKSLKSVFLDITNACNLNCKYCNKNTCKDVKKAKFITLNDVKIYMDKLFEYNDEKPFLVNITGGEPLLHNDIKSIFKIIKEYNCRIVLWTNGMLMDLSKGDLIKKYCDYVMISIDHFDEDRNDNIRGKGSFRNVIKSTEIFNKKNIPYFLAITPLKYNIDNLEEAIPFSYKLGANGFLINEPIYINELGNKLHENFEYPLSKLQDKYNYYKKKTSIINSWKNDKLKSNRKTKFNLIFIQDIKKCTNTIFNILNKNSCGAGINEISINAYGEVYPCHALHIKQFSLGYIDDYIKNDKQFVNVNDINNCKKCSFKIFCLGGCRAQAFFNTYNIKGIYPSCEYDKNEYNQILWSPLKPVEENKDE